MLFLAALLFASAACTQVKVTSSVAVIDAQPSVDTAADASANDVTSDTAEVADGTLEDVTGPVQDTTSPDTASDTPICVPTCDDVECGDDGCGGVCGECEEGTVCASGSCCAPQCENKACGDDTCGGVCGTCAQTDTCQEGACVSGQVCEPNCVDIYCGDDGCSGSCGECLQLDELDGEAATKDSELRSLYAMGIALGESAFVDELGARLAQAGLPGAVTLLEPVTSGTSFDYNAGKLSCPMAAYGPAPEPEEQDCDQWANESSGGVYADVVASLANPANMPGEVAATGYGKDAETAYLSGVKTGNERGRARSRWDLAATETPVCDGNLGPISASKTKGVIVGAQHFANVLNMVSDAQSFSFAGEYPAVPSQLALCSFSESLLQVAHEMAKAFEVSELPTPEPCGLGYNPPPEYAETYTLAQAAFGEGLLIGIDAEYYVASVAFFEGAQCGLGP
jgi:hypothetical protein